MKEETLPCSLSHPQNFQLSLEHTLNKLILIEWKNRDYGWKKSTFNLIFSELRASLWPLTWYHFSLHFSRRFSLGQGMFQTIQEQSLSCSFKKFRTRPQKLHETKPRYSMNCLSSQALPRKVIMENLVSTGPLTRYLHFKVWQIFIGLLISFLSSLLPHPPVLPVSSSPPPEFPTLCQVQTY